ncbi:MAG: hypothetical protein K2H43_00845, partial [Clostridia bacterium]|nr:hypothetical protein [Clostridia bacterium]
VPESLVKLTVRGGVFPAEALYRCGGLEEVVLCGLDAENVSARAFAGCTGLKLVHTPRRLTLSGNFSERPLGCGCWEYSEIVL